MIQRCLDSGAFLRVCDSEGWEAVIDSSMASCSLIRHTLDLLLLNRVSTNDYPGASIHWPIRDYYCPHSLARGSRRVAAVWINSPFLLIFTMIFCPRPRAPCWLFWTKRICAHVNFPWKEPSKRNEPLIRAKFHSGKRGPTSQQEETAHQAVPLFDINE